jgi:hypothetical protein
MKEIICMKQGPLTAGTPEATGGERSELQAKPSRTARMKSGAYSAGGAQRSQLTATQPRA